jgi:hypothetical protein
LLPVHRELKALFDECFETVKPTVLAETLSVFDKTEVEKGAHWTEAERLALANKLSALSTLEGIQYYSASRKTMRTFYEKAHLIGSPSDKKRLPDPVYARLPSRTTVYALMKDLSFGENVYKISYYFYESAVVFVQENTGTVFFGPIPIAGKQDLRSIAAVINGGDQRLVYAASMVHAPSLPGFNNKIGASFSNRLDALLEWLGD